MTNAPSLHAPKLTAVHIDGVDLYNEGTNVDIELSKSVSAFVGANGIGKSTLLAIVNFGVTGVVPDASVSFQSIEEFIEGTASFARDYFDGRVLERNRSSASVMVVFEMNGKSFEVERGLFDGGNVRAFRIKVAGETVLEVDSGQAASATTAAYREAIVEHSGLASYEQFCFWQLFMMTFDERRHLLFWDDKTLQSALMIALGHSPSDAVKAEKLSRNIEKLESLARNARWRATQATNKRSRLIQDSTNGHLSEEELLMLEQRYEDLLDAESSTRKLFDESETQRQDSERTLAELAISESEIEAQYLSVFVGTSSHRKPEDHPVMRAVSADGKCDLCGTSTHSFAPAVVDAMHHHACPLCATPLEPETTAGIDEAELVRLDTELTNARAALSDARVRSKRIRDDSAVHARTWTEASDSLQAFLAQNRDALVPSNKDARAAEVRRYDQEIAEALRETDDYRRRRDESKQELLPIISGLAASYEQVEVVFVPTFQRLAERFIGRSVDVQFERSGVSLGLRFGLDGQPRRYASELSESQQFFVDIALRMSIIETFVHGTSTLLIDTPEGSLDIAYETRAGSLFGEFVQGGNCLVVMSNLNSSNLLKKLTAQSTPADMTIHKMIEWSRLSEVQLESAHLFDAVYMELLASLESDGQ